MIDGAIFFILDLISAFLFLYDLIGKMRGVEIVDDCWSDLRADAPT